MKALKINIKGFTLIEAIIAIAILGVIGFTLSELLVKGFKGSNKAELIGNIKQNGQVAMNIIDQTIRKADSVVCLSSPTPAKTIVILDKNNRYIRFNIVPGDGLNNNGYITADDPTLNVQVKSGDSTCATLSSLPGPFDPQCVNRLCATSGEIYSPVPNALTRANFNSSTSVLTNFDTATGVSVKDYFKDVSGVTHPTGFSRYSVETGVKDSIGIFLDFGAAVKSGYDYATKTQADVQFSTTVQLR
jgi:prepilin-type N-terminal cleavage/methylation domain-containing protein